MLTLRRIAFTAMIMLGCAGVDAAWAIPVSPDKNTAVPAKKEQKKPEATTTAPVAPAAPQPPPNPLLQVIRGAKPEPVTPNNGN